MVKNVNMSIKYGLTYLSSMIFLHVEEQFHMQIVTLKIVNIFQHDKKAQQ